MAHVSFHTVTESSPVEVQALWDRTHQDYVLHVIDEDVMADLDAGDHDEEAYVWSTTDHYAKGTLKTTEPLRARLAEMGIEVPVGFWEILDLRESDSTYTLVSGVWKMT
jgi:hypothetical protein